LWSFKKVFKSSTQPKTRSWIERSSSHTGNGKYPAVGSSGEYWSISESLNQGFAGMKGQEDREGQDGRKVRALSRDHDYVWKRIPG